MGKNPSTKRSTVVAVKDLTSKRGNGPSNEKRAKPPPPQLGKLNGRGGREKSASGELGKKKSQGGYHSGKLPDGEFQNVPQKGEPLAPVKRPFYSSLTLKGENGFGLWSKGDWVYIWLKGVGVNLKKRLDSYVGERAVKAEKRLERSRMRLIGTAHSVLLVVQSTRARRGGGKQP